MDSNKQESYTLPECCQHCVEADGFLGAKGCSNRTCECHKESQEGVEELITEFLHKTDPNNFPTEQFHRKGGDHLLDHNWYPESSYELDRDKIADWLRQKLTSLNTKKHE